MAKAQIEIKNEEHYHAVERIMAINNLPNGNRELVINKAIEIAYDAVTMLDEESLVNVTNLKKSI